MSLFNAKDYMDFIEKHVPTETYLDRVNREAKDMVKLWIEAQGELMFRHFWQLATQDQLTATDVHIPTQAELKAIFAAYLDCQNRTNAMMRKLTKGVKL